MRTLQVLFIAAAALSLLPQKLTLQPEDFISLDQLCVFKRSASQAWRRSYAA